MEDQIPDIVTDILAIISTAAAGGLAAVLGRFKSAMRPLAARRAVKICLVAPVETGRDGAARFRDSLRRAGYTDVRLTHSCASASGDIVILWQPPLDLASTAPLITTVREAAPEAYLCIYVQGFIQGLKLDDLTHLVNSLLRLRVDLGGIAEQVVADRQQATAPASA